MTNEVSTTSGTQLPAFLQAHLQQNKPSADVASLATSQNSTPRLSLRGKVFRFMNGQEEVFKSGQPVEVFIVGVEPGPGRFTKTFYKDAYAGADSSGNPPDCSSADGVRPDPWIQQPVHHECGSCPKNQFGSATSRRGKPAKACHDSKRLFVQRCADPAPVAERTLYLSQAPVTSLKSLAAYGTTMQGMGVEPWMVKTRLSMNEDSEFPELQFAVAGFIEEKDMAAMKERAEKREWAISRNLMLQSSPQRQALPDHLKNVLGGAGGSAAAQPSQPAPNNLAGPAIDPTLTAQAAATVESGEAPKSSNDILRKW